uniref:SNF2 domain-containing protein CLASSY 3-like n=1 Tax=Erigeron canadensis TaxID=72917 RepID=UPI001CB94037|nr:SNF2 domain-containing protein CLASSY 3-like [Erigeron canadensis]
MAYKVVTIVIEEGGVRDCLSRPSSRNRKRNRERGDSQSSSRTKQDFPKECLEENKDSKAESVVFYGSTKRKVDEVKKVDGLLLDELEEEKDPINGSEGFCRTIKREVDELVKKVNESFLEDELEDENEINDIDVINISSESSNDSDSDYVYVSEEEQEEADKDLPKSHTHYHASTSNTKARPYQSIEDDPSSSSDNESDDDSLPNNTLKQPAEKHSPMDISPIYILIDTDESERAGSDSEESHVSLKENDGLKETDNIECTDISTKSKGYSSANSFKTRMHANIICLSDDSDSENTIVLEEQEDADEALQKCFKYGKHKIRSGLAERKKKNRSSTKGVNYYYDDDDEDPLTSIGRERNKNQSTTKNQLPKETKREKNSNCSAQKANMKKMYEKPMSKSSGSIDDILDSVIKNKAGLGENGGDCLPLKFRFEDSEDESMSQKTDEFNAEGLFEEMDFVLDCEEIGSYRTPMVNNQEKADHNDTVNLCERGEHSDIYLEEQTGLRCRLCGAVLLESRYVISKLANYAPDRSQRSYHYDEQQWSSFGNPYLEASDCPDIMCNETQGTVWELIPTSISSQLYPHQQEGFKFLWENLAGTIELSGLEKLGPRGGGGGGGGCIISHAPGTGKTLLTIVFIETFLKRFPRCCPVIVAPASMLLTWEAEFEKWQVGFSFINLNCSDLRKGRTNGSSRHNKDFIRALKISSWSNGGSILGISYNLYTKLAGISNTKNKSLEKMRNVLLDMPGLVILDEGHTPRNQESNIWNTLLKLKTKNRVILSGTPFQNNFRELFNTLRLVRPETATNIMNEKIFADMIQQNTKRSRSRSTYEDVEKLKKIISPFVHVHKGHILESKLPGLKQAVILLDPPAIQKSFIENLGNMTTTFEYEYKVALVSVHPSLILHCSLSEKEEKSVNQQELEKMRLQPDCGVKTRFVLELIRLSVSLHEKVLIFSQYVRPFKLLQDQVARAFGWNVGTEIMVIGGKTNQMHRQKIINDFNDPNGKVKVLLASTRCCSEGIHLYGASRVVLLDVVWNPSVERQAISRAYRLGQKKVVYTYHLMAAGTTEEEKYDRQVEKARLAEMVFSSGSMARAEVSKKVMDDHILQHMVDHHELKHMFKKIKYPENETRVS